MNSDINPALVRRPKRVRPSSMTGKYAYYLPHGISENDEVPKGSLVQIQSFDHNGGKDFTLVTVTVEDISVTGEHTVFLKDLGFIHAR